MHLSDSSKGTLCMLISAVLFATGGLVLKWVDWNPLAINGVRSLFGALVIGGYMLVIRHPLRWNRITLFGALCYLCMTTLFVVANKMTSAANTIVLQYSAPVWIIVINFLVFHKRPGRLETGAIICVMAGILCFFADSLHSGHLAGDLIALISGIFYGILFMLNSIPKGDALSSVLMGQAAACILFAPLGVMQPWNLPTLGSLIWLGAFQVGAAYIFFCTATRLIPPLKAALITGVEPVLNPLLVALFWHEQLSALSLIGACIVIVSITLYSAISSRIPPSRPIGQT